MNGSMPSLPTGPAESRETTALARRNQGLFAQPGIREAIRGATGLSEDQADQVAAGLARIGVALLLPDSADMQGRYANAIALVRDHDYSIRKAARELGISASHLARKVDSIGASGDLQARAAAGDRRILEMSQAMSTLAAETLLERLESEGDELKTTELTKIYTAATNQVAAKQRWSQGSTERVIDEGMSAIAKLLRGNDITVTKRDAAMDAIDVTPLDSD